MEFDELKAIEYINNHLERIGASTYADDEILNVIDIIWDYYEDNGFLDLDCDDVDSIDISTLVKHVQRMLSKDKFAQIATDDVAHIVEGEVAYEKSIGLIE